MQATDLIDRLREHGVAFVDGLTDAEVDAVETRFGFRFPPDLRAFLQTALPHGEDFPDWRSENETDLREWLDLPRQGVMFDIEFNDFWLEEWGPRSSTLDEAKRIAEALISAAPPLIPIYAHRMMPAEPHLPGNPVFSVHQTDIIVYGVDLKDYLIHEFLTAEEDMNDHRSPSMSARSHSGTSIGFRKSAGPMARASSTTAGGRSQVSIKTDNRSVLSTTGETTIWQVANSWMSTQGRCLSSK